MADHNAMSSNCPGGRHPGRPGGYVGEYRGMEWVLCPWVAGITEFKRIISVAMNWGWGILHRGRQPQQKPLTRGLCLTKLPHPWGKWSSLPHAFYNLPGRQADDIAYFPRSRAHWKRGFMKSTNIYLVARTRFRVFPGQFPGRGWTISRSLGWPRERRWGPAPPHSPQERSFVRTHYGRDVEILLCIILSLCSEGLDGSLA